MSMETELARLDVTQQSQEKRLTNVEKVAEDLVKQSIIFTTQMKIVAWVITLVSGVVFSDFGIWAFHHLASSGGR